MSKISHLFLRKPSGILNIYFTAGFPNLHDTVPIIQALANAGVDMIEIGMPYSDPLADGLTIQQSSEIALANGMTMQLLFDQVREARSQVDIPIVWMGYFNQVMQFGIHRFVEACKETGLDGLIIPDLPVSTYEKEVGGYFKQAGLDVIFLLTPQTQEDRIRKLDDCSNGFLYVVSQASVTGGQKGFSPTQLAYFERLANMELRNPRLIGFGISDKHAFETACQYANGAIIGSAFIKALQNGKEDVVAATQAFVESIRTTVSETV